MEKGNEIYPPHLLQKFNTKLSEERFSDMFSIEVTNEDEITEDTIKYYDENYKIGDKEPGKKQKPIDNENELETLYQQRLESYLKVIEHSKETDFLKDELEQVNNLLSHVDKGTLQKSNHYGIMKRYEEIINQKISELLPPGTTNLKKIKWLGNASHLGYIIYQLAQKGYIEFPNHKGEVNYTGLAERLLNGFEFEGKQPNKKYLSEQINPDSENNKIADVTKGKLKIDIADRTDLS